MNKKFFYSKTGIRIISLVIAIFLYIFVANENNIYRLRSASNQQFASVNVTETLSNVPVAVGAIGEDMFISGLPESVQVRLTGPRNVLNQVLEQNIVVETEDLTEREAGPQYIRLILPDLPSSVDYQITPSQRYVRLSLIKSIKQKIEYEIDDNLTSDAYEVSNVDIIPEEVELIGDVEIIDQVHRAFITISSNEFVSESFTRTYSLRIVDEKDEILDVNANISEIETNVEISRPEKNVRINLIAFGENQSDYQYEYKINNPEEISIVGNRSRIDSIDELDYIIDVTNLRHSDTIQGKLQVPRNIELKENPEITIDVIMNPIQSDSIVEEINSSNSETTVESNTETTVESNTETSESTNENDNGDMSSILESTEGE